MYEGLYEGLYDWLGFPLDPEHCNDLELLMDGPTLVGGEQEAKVDASQEALLSYLRENENHSLPSPLRLSCWLQVSHNKKFVFSDSEALLETRWSAYQRLSDESAIKSQITQVSIGRTLRAPLLTSTLLGFRENVPRAPVVRF